MYHTSNLFVAAVLVLLDNQLHSIDATTPTKAVFYFQDFKKAQADVAEYWAGRVELNAKTLFDTIAKLKSDIRDAS